MSSCQDTISDNVRVLMALNRQRQADLARRMGWSQANISLKLLGRSRWNTDDLDKLSDIFGVSPADLVTDVPFPRSLLRERINATFSRTLRAAA